MNLHKRLTWLALIGLAIAGIGVQPPSALSTQTTAQTGIVMNPIRTEWPIVREAAGQWVVLGEASLQHQGSATVTLTSARLEVLDSNGKGLAQREYGRADFREMFLIFGTTGGRLQAQPEGTAQLNPRDLGFLFVWLLVDSAAPPARARVSATFEGGNMLTAEIPLVEFIPAIQPIFPLRGGPWLAVNSIGSPNHWRALFIPSLSTFYISQRFAIDLVKLDERGHTTDKPNPKKEDFYAWGEPIMSIAPGRVVHVEDAYPDQEIGSADPERPAGNFVAIEHGPNLYSFYAHMQLGSVAVRVDDMVEAGRVLGRVGNSGNTTEPHLHLQLTDRPELFRSQGLPLLFWNAQVQRGAVTLPLNGTTPLDNDLVVAPAQ